MLVCICMYISYTHLMIYPLIEKYHISFSYSVHTHRKRINRFLISKNACLKTSCHIRQSGKLDNVTNLRRALSFQTNNKLYCLNFTSFFSKPKQKVKYWWKEFFQFSSDKENRIDTTHNATNAYLCTYMYKHENKNPPCDFLTLANLSTYNIKI